MQVEISARLLRLVSDIAQQQGRAEEEVLEEAVVRYLREMGVEDADIGRELGEIYVEPLLRDPSAHAVPHSSSCSAGCAAASTSIPMRPCRSP